MESASPYNEETVPTEMGRENIMNPENEMETNEEESNTNVGKLQKETFFQCDACKHAFSKYFKLKEHVENVQKYITAHRPLTTYSCWQGTKKQFVIIYRKKLNCHMQKKHPEKMYECSVCDKKFRKMVHLKVHAKLHKKTKMPFECSNCKKRFISSFHLENHITVSNRWDYT